MDKHKDTKKSGIVIDLYFKNSPTDQAKYSKDDYIDVIAKTVLESGKLTQYAGSMLVYLKAILGMKQDFKVIKKLHNLQCHLLK